MPKSNFIPAGERHHISIEVENLSAKDAHFLGQVIALFTDPAREAQANEVRAARQIIAYGPHTGQGLVMPNNIFLGAN